MSLDEKNDTCELTNDPLILEKISKWVTTQTSPVEYVHYGTLRTMENESIVSNYKQALMVTMDIRDISFEKLIENYHRIIFCKELPKESSPTEIFRLLIMRVSKDDESDKYISFMMMYNDNMCTFHLSRFRPCYGPSWEGPSPNKLSFCLLRLDDSGNPMERVLLTTINTKS